MKTYAYRFVVFLVLTTLATGTSLWYAYVARGQSQGPADTTVFLPSVAAPAADVAAASEEEDEEEEEVATIAHRSPGALPENFGSIYAELSARWWQFTVDQLLKEDRNVLGEAGAVDCRAGQRGAVWFLFGTDGSAATDAEGRTYRECAKPIPAGKALFFPLLNGVFYNGPGESYTVLEKRTILDEQLIPLACNVRSSIDGVPTVFSGIGTVRTQSQPFTYKALAPGGALVQDDEAISEGFWVMLRPDPGQHEIRIEGAFCDPQTGEPFFSVDVTYDLTVR